MNKSFKKAFFVAGGTAGHINSALALGDYFSGQEFSAYYISGTRHLDYKLFKDRACIHLEARAIMGQSLFNRLLSLFANVVIFLKAAKLFLKERPRFVLGAGGYICGPVLMAAFVQRIPIYIVEQNAVMGLTNKLLALFAKKIFVHFQKTKGLPKRLSAKCVVSGNPIRSSIGEKAKQPHAELVHQDGGLNFLVFGGSLGAKSINDLVYGLLDKSFPYPLQIIHQVGAGNKTAIQARSESIKYTQKEYLDDMGAYYDWAHIILSRAGASTVAELRVVKKPVILIPYPLHADKHQYINAHHLQNEVSFPVFVQEAEELTSNDYSKLLEILEKVRKNDYLVGPDKINGPSADEATSRVYQEIIKDVIH